MNRPLVSRPNVLALLVGSVAFAALYLGYYAGLYILFNWWFYPLRPPDDLPQTIVSSRAWSVYGWASYLIPGFLAGFYARRAGLMHGAIVGALTMPIMAGILYATGNWSSVDYSSLLYGLELGLIWCSLAGILGEFISSRVRPK